MNFLEQLQRDLARAEIQPFAWVINQSLTPLTVSDPVLRQRQAAEPRFHLEVQKLSSRVVLVPWTSAMATTRLELAAKAPPALEVSP